MPLIPALGDFSRQGFSVPEEPGTLVDQAGLELKEIHQPLPQECWN